jgi:single-strand DNA-binding protein
MYLNKAFVIGNLTRDPELKSLPSGIKVTSFSVATNRVWMKDGAKQESTDYHNIVVFGRQAETSAQYLRKGSNVLVEGRMQTRSWDAEGGKKYRTEIIADRVQFGNRPASEGGPSASGGSYKKEASGGPSSNEGAQEAPMDNIEYPDAESEGISVDDIPF